MTSTHYETLGVPENASPTQVRVAYCTAVWPAWIRGEQDKEQALRAARVVLCTKPLREAYDESIGISQRKIEAATSQATNPPVSAIAPNAAAEAAEPAIRLPKPQGPPPSPGSVWPPERPPRRLGRRLVLGAALVLLVVAVAWLLLR